MKCTLLALVCVGLVACGGPEIRNQVAAVPADEDIVQREIERGDAAWAKRHDHAQLEQAVGHFKEALKYRPADPELLTRYSAACYWMADAVLDADKTDERMAMYLEGRDAGLRAFNTHEGFRTAYAEDDEIETAVKSLPGSFAGSLLWTGANWARWGELKGIIRTAIDIPKVRAIYEQLLAVDRAYIAGAADRFFGAFFVSVPIFAGYSQEKSKEHFDKALEYDSAYLENLYMYAWYYARAAEDGELYRSLLERVLAAPPDAEGNPHRLPNDQSRLHAKRALEDFEEYFDEEDFEDDEEVTQ